MANYGHIIFFSLIGGVFSLIGGVLLLSNKRMAEILAKYATPFAAGALLAAVFLDLLKDGIEEASANTVLGGVLAGIIIFFFLERFLGWFHHHHQHEEIHKHPGISLIVIGDTLHNALDGVAIAASFLISVPTGIVTTIAVAAHEIPQEISDFGLLLAKGMNRSKVLWVNVMSALATTAAALITFALGSADKLPLGVILGVSAGFLLYIAMSDIIPTIHESSPSKKFFNLQPFMMIIGLIVVGLSIQFAHRYIDTGHDHSMVEEHHYEDHDKGENPTSVTRTIDGKLYKVHVACTEDKLECSNSYERIYSTEEQKRIDKACEQAETEPQAQISALDELSYNEYLCRGGNL